VLNFITKEEYQEWIINWKKEYLVILDAIRRSKRLIKHRQRMGKNYRREQNKHQQLVDRATVMINQRQQAKIRANRIHNMHEQLVEQDKQFPLTLDAKVVDFSFNRIHNEFPFMPRWIVKANGKTFYLEHVDCHLGFETQELENGNTKGMFRFRNITLTIENRIGKITAKEKMLKAAT
jgi:hypothetical protein